jgi:two-component SAPR family response regulator
MNILAVDDEYYALELMKRALEEVAGGATVYLCRDVKSALQTATETKIDVAFLDIHMPEMNGVELARELKLLNPKVNIVFATGFSEYMKEGIDLRMSGYIMKPVTPEAVKTELENLRNPIEWSKEKRIKILTFGNFDVFVDGKPLKFERKQAKEILAYLVDKQGAGVTRSDVFATVWEDQPYDRRMQKQLDVYIRSLRDTLREYGISEIMEMKRGILRILPGTIVCDAYLFFSGDSLTINSYRGEYMSSYSWASITEAILYWKAANI